MQNVSVVNERLMCKENRGVASEKERIKPVNTVTKREG